MAARKAKPGFSDVVEELEALIETLEDSDTTLEDSMKAFEKGMSMVSAARKMLEEAEQKVLLLTETEEGELDVYEVDEDETE